MSSKKGQGGRWVDSIVNNCLEYLLVHQFHRQVVLNLKAKNFRRVIAEYLQGLQSPERINMQTKNYIRNELYLPSMYYNFKNSYTVFFFKYIVSRSDSKHFLNGQAWAPTTKMSRLPSTARMDQSAPTSWLSEQPIQARGENFSFCSLFPFFMLKRDSHGGRKKKGVTILRKIVGLDVTPYCSD